MAYASLVSLGFEDDLMAIKARLCGQSSRLELISIFGMGGIGKTTLARNAFDDPLSVEHFDIRAWVTVSQNYSARAILSDLVSMKAESSRQSDESQMAESVYKSLKGRRYFIVMDDACGKIFPEDNNGSRFILTTRLFNLATYPERSGPLHEMHFMDSDQSWNLLQQKVFAQENCPPELKTVGKTIAISCRGIYPEDYEIHVSEIIKLWVAEGFSTPEGPKSSEEVAEEHLEGPCEERSCAGYQEEYPGQTNEM